MPNFLRKIDSSMGCTTNSEGEYWNLPMIKELLNLTIFWCETIAAPTIGSHDNLICTVIAKSSLAGIGPDNNLTIDYIILILGKPYHIATIQIDGKLQACGHTYPVLFD